MKGQQHAPVAPDLEAELIDCSRKRRELQAASDAAIRQIDALRKAIQVLPRYQEHDIVRRPSTAEYVNADDLADLLAPPQEEGMSGGTA